MEANSYELENDVRWLNKQRELERAQKPLKIRPMVGQVLIQVLPAETQTDTGLFLPDIAADAPRGEKQRPIKGRVIALGPWRKTKNGFGVLPDFGIGHTVICTPYRGTKLSRNIGERYQLVSAEDVLAVVENPP